MATLIEGEHGKGVDRDEQNERESSRVSASHVQVQILKDESSIEKASELIKAVTLVLCVAYVHGAAVAPSYFYSGKVKKVGGSGGGSADFEAVEGRQLSDMNVARSGAAYANPYIRQAIQEQQ
ncbi:unnamed protein product, partial [Cyprideis torosa]